MNFWPVGVQVIRSGESLPKKENIFLISNHQAMADIPALLSVACECERQRDLKWFVKDPIKWVPGIGWGMLFMDCLFVKRNWMADKEKVTKTFSRLKRNKSPFWVISFAEGTRITPKKKKRSQEFAKKMNLPILENVMLPRTKGFEATLEGLDTIEAIYDITIGYENSPPHLLELFFTPIERMHVNVQRYPMSAIPSSNEGRSAWVIERFVEKDKKLANFKIPF
jgi:1-acyl-sn-glycerol-3-phosphate acyltransferase